MAERTRVKICGLTRPEDVEMAIELGADALGFVHEPTSPRYVKDERALLAGVPPFMPTVGVYGRYTKRQDECALVQAVHFRDYSLSLVFEAQLDQDPRPGLFAFRFEEDVDLEAAIKIMDAAIEPSHVVCRGIVIDGFSKSGYGGMGVKADWHLATEIVQHYYYPVILAGGLTPDNVAGAVEMVRPYAVDVSSGIESSPGVKDHVMMRDFIQAARG